VYIENYIKINNYITLLMDAEEVIQENNDQDIAICEECAGEINCNKDNIYILTKEEENDKLWCQSCFEELWKEYSINGWTGDDIEYYLELENEENETS
jgi:enolase